VSCKRRNATTNFSEKVRRQSRPRSFKLNPGFAAEGAPVVAVWTTDDVVAEAHGEVGWWRVRERAGALLTKPAPLLIEFSDGLFAAVATLENSLPLCCAMRVVCQH
jgi:hypothetical protein